MSSPLGIQIHDQLIELEQGALFVRQWRPDQLISDIPLVMLHDSLGSVGQWRHLPEQLAERLQRRVIAYDRLGYGRSSRVQDRPKADFIQHEAQVLFPALCDKLGITQFGLLGHSVGGVMALTIASAHSGCVAAITLAAQAYVEERTLEGIRQAQQQFGHPSAFAKLDKWHGEKAQWVLDAWTETWLSPDFRSWSLASTLAKVEIPVLILHGDRDEYGSVAFAQTIHAQVSGPSHLVIFADCGHLPHVEYTQAVLDRVTDFYTF